MKKQQKNNCSCQVPDLITKFKPHRKTQSIKSCTVVRRTTGRTDKVRTIAYLRN